VYRIECAPIVYSRTYEVDFRFIVVPEDFQQDSQSDFQLRNRDWLENHIHSTTLLVERLPDCPRWSIFKNTRHCIVGLTCMATEISEDKTRDRESRPLYLFLGYVFRSPVGFQPIPMDLEHFKKLYRYVSENWEEKLYGTTGRVPILEKYQEIPSTKSSQNAAISLDATIKLNLEPNKIRIWTDSEEFRQKLWLAACAAQQPVSLCLGLPNQAAALKGHFLNSTILDFNVDLDKEHYLQQRRTSDKGSASSAKVIPSSEGEGQSNNFSEEMISGIKQLGQQVVQVGQQVVQAGQDVIESLAVSDPYADEDTNLDEGEQPSKQQEALDDSRNRTNSEKQRDHSYDNYSEPNKSIDVGFKPKKSGQDDSNNGEDWF